MENRKSRFLPLLAILLCMTMIVGATFALFTSKKRINIAVNAAEVDLEASIKDGSLRTFSLGVEQTPGEFELGGTAEITEGRNLELDQMAPGDKAEFIVEIEDKSTIDIMWRVSWTITGELADALVVTRDGQQYADTDWSDWALLNSDKIETTIAVELPYDFTEQTKNGTDIDATIIFTVEAVQANMPDNWDGTASTTWIEEVTQTLSADPTADEFEIDSAEDLAAFATLVNGAATATIAEGDESNLADVLLTKEFKLTTNVDLSGQNFAPIGGVDKGVAFQGTFDGQGHTIYGLTQNGWDLGYAYGQTAGMGLFGWIGDATIKNVTLEGAEISMEAVVMGGIAGYAAGECTFENITIKNTQLANYNWDTGGIVGQAYGGEESHFVFKNINIDETNTISGHWGTWDVSAGGVIGRTTEGVTVEMENINVACVLDVYNDVVAAYQWYAYRYSGMLVGYTKTTATDENGRTVATAPHVTCKNVTVTYGEWAKYTYCQPSNVSPQYVRVQGGYSTDPYYSGRHWTAGVDAAGNKMVDDNHVHAEGQAHNELIIFDQLFGGGQGVYGTATHDGVTVIYNYSK